MTIDLKTWKTADRLCEVAVEDLRWILHDPQALLLLFAEMNGRQNRKRVELSVTEFLTKASHITRNLTMEITRRAIAEDRAKLKFLGDLKIKDLDTPCDYPRGEFIRAFAMRFRERTGIEVNESEMTRLLLDHRMI